MKHFDKYEGKMVDTSRNTFIQVILSPGSLVDAIKVINVGEEIPTGRPGPRCLTGVGFLYTEGHASQAA